jgi:transposase
MPHHIDANYDQLFLLPPSIEDWVPPDHPARFIRAFVDQFDLSCFTFANAPSTEGRPRYSNKLLLKIWLYCRMHKMKSLREMEAGCYRDIGLLWLTGMNYPDHNTLWRFYQNNGRHLRKILKQLLEIATRGGLVGLVVQALDGTKIEAMVREGQGCSKTMVKKILTNLDEIAIELSETEDDVSAKESYRLPDNLSDPGSLNDLVRSLLRAQSKGEKVTLAQGMTKQAVKETLQDVLSRDEGICHPTDPDARMMTCDNGKAFGYNAQIVVDDKHGLIVGEAVTQEANDCHQLSPMIDQTIENTGETSQVTLADGNYCTGEELLKAAEMGAAVLVNDTKEDQASSEPFHICNFTYNEDDDSYTCPLGEKLYFRRELKGNGTAMDREYICKNLTCTKKDECTTSKRGRTIRRSGYIDVIRSNRKALAEPKNKALLARRKTIVEPVFGHIKHNEGYRRWRVCGLAQVGAEWTVICLTYNLKKIFQLWKKGLFRFPGFCAQELKV